MFVTNPFAELSLSFSPGIMQAYVVLMIVLVVGGTLFDVWHKASARYFFENWRKADAKGTNATGSGELVSAGLQTALHDVATSAEFCNPHRRIAHLLGMYGFIIFALTSAILVFCYPTSASAGLWPFLWTLGALMICAGGYWFWFFIRADVSAEGASPFRLMRADLFILSLLSMATCALLWAFFQAIGAGFLNGLFFALFLIATTVLFGSVPWSKFSHMFFKPAAALQKRMAVVNGSMDNLPPPADRTDPATRDRHSMQLLKDAPLDMGLGIKREQPRHY